MPIVNISTLNDSDFYRIFQYRNSANTPINVTGNTMVMMLRRFAKDEVVVLRLGSDTGEINIYDPINGAFAIYISQAKLEEIGVGDFAHSLVMTIDGWLKRGIWSGAFTIGPGPSR